MNNGSQDQSAKLKYLELIQGIISRLASNLFFLKGWSITLVVGFLALITAKDAKPIYSFMMISISWAQNLTLTKNYKI